ncbi:hypothetical protein F4680DRAFT_444062 [Xylaria scruposa]|nr:hypothetical protein F4680DRAFT_444062 [Xylaria scruposa]
MSYYQHPHVRTLKVIADNWWREPTLNSTKSSRTDAPHDAKALARLVSTSSWAVQDPYSEGVARFLKWYRKTQTIDLQTLSNIQLEKELCKFMFDIDELFFFSLLTRKIEKKSELDRFVRLRITGELPNGSYCGSYSLEETSPYIRMHRVNQQGEPRPFEHMLYTLVHEMCHAFLDLFSDKRHSRHREFVIDYRGHGEMFWVLLRFVSRKLGAYTRSERWQKELEWMELECLELTQSRGEPGSWGTPEKILMGGVWAP